MRDSSLAHEIQSIGTMYLLNACAGQKIKKFIMASTTDVYGALPSNPNYLSEGHETRGGIKSKFIRDKIDAENQALKYAKIHPETIVTILRPCTILGPKIRDYKTTFLSRTAVFTVMGFDPLMQFVHEEDVIGAFNKVLTENYPGIYNIVGEGILPLSKVMQLSGKLGIPVPSPMLYPMAQLMWYTDIFPAPASHLDFLKYLCVADGRKAKKKMGFVPRYTSKDALLSFIGAERLRRMHLEENNAVKRTLREIETLD
jgi:UDP-glucose 4-epimerase